MNNHIFDQNSAGWPEIAAPAACLCQHCPAQHPTGAIASSASIIAGLADIASMQNARDGL